MASEGSPARRPDWLRENGPGQLELLLQAVVFHPLVPLLIADNEGRCHEASAGAGKLIGLSREEMLGRRVDDFAHPEQTPRFSEQWRASLDQPGQAGALQLAGPGGAPAEVLYSARRNVLPVRHLLVLQKRPSPDVSHARVPPWVDDYALSLIDVEGRIAAWYGGAARLHGYEAHEAAGQPVWMLHPAGDAAAAEMRRVLDRAAAEGHFTDEGWRLRKDGTRFWANAITAALRDSDGVLQGFAQVVRDFTARHERDGKLLREHARRRTLPARPAVACIASGEFDRIVEANDAFLDLTGYTRADLTEGRLHWSGLTPPEYAPLDDLAHEEGLRFGACTPYRKELARKDGGRAPVLVATAVLALCPFRWIAFLQDLRGRDGQDEPESGADAPAPEFESMVGGSAALRRVQRQIEVVAPTDANVLILGETGSGKELMARAIHHLSPRKQLPFVTLNCAAIPTGLLESELFGYERGAFTGALARKIGRFEMAHRGTLFLDEVGDIPLELQPKLLRALQEKTFERLGGTTTIPIDVRLVAATNRNLTQMMSDKLFRGDLYYRLRVFPITAPPLRDHPEDIPVLARHFTQIYAAKMGRRIERIPPETMRALVAWPWPGNVRELENFIERSVILSPGTALRAPVEELRPSAEPRTGDDTLARVEREHILRVVRECGGVVTTAAARLGLHRTTLNALMRRLDISRRNF